MSPELGKETSGSDDKLINSIAASVAANAIANERLSKGGPKTPQLLAEQVAREAIMQYRTLSGIRESITDGSEAEILHERIVQFDERMQQMPVAAEGGS